MNIAYGILAALALAIGAFFYGDHIGGLASKTALEGFQATQAQNTATAVLAERASGAAELARVNTILKGYQDAPVDPVALSLGSRVLQYARVADCPVPSAGTAPAAAGSPSPVSSGPSGVERALDALTEACAQDASELTALQQAWPR